MDLRARYRSPMANRSKLTCHACRSRKVRCDGKQPACSRCIHADRDCSYVKARQFTFRHSSLSSVTATSNRERSPVQTVSQDERAQTTVSVPNFEPHGSPIYGGAEAAFSPLVSASAYSPEQSRNGVSSSGESFLSPVAHTTSLGAPTPGHGFGGAISSPQSYTRQNGKPSSIHLTPLEGELLHFFVCNIGPWLDVTSPERHYTYYVPMLALQWPLLLYSIMTSSAHILRLISKDQRADLIDEEADYQNKCLEILIPLLDDLNAAFQDEVVLATITILRMSEQYEEFHVDRQFHLVPEAFDHFRSTGQPSSTTLGGLREATFYSYVRADIRMSILGKKGTRIKIDCWPLDTTLINDADWANRMTYLLVQAINLSFGNNVAGLLPRDELLHQVDEWKASLPKSFDPYYYQEESEEDAFPIVRLLCPWHAVGLQFYHAAKILLATSFSQQEQAFSDMLQFHKHISSEVLPHARMLCGISFSNKHHGCRINASHLIALGAQYFTGRQEQWRVLTYFEMLQDESAWPSKACREMLEAAYGYSIGS